MKYELAKKLKDAGFPQDLFITRSHVAENREIVMIPTLSELIEACGDKAITIQNRKDAFGFDAGLGLNDLFQWHANAQFGEDGGFNNLTGNGETPEEAVANLWLLITYYGKTN
jgi:hypothetical protein